MDETSTGLNLITDLGLSKTTLLKMSFCGLPAKAYASTHQKDHGSIIRSGDLTEVTVSSERAEVAGIYLPIQVNGEPVFSLLHGLETLPFVILIYNHTHIDVPKSDGKPHSVNLPSTIFPTTGGSIPVFTGGIDAMNSETIPHYYNITTELFPITVLLYSNFVTTAAGGVSTSDSLRGRVNDAIRDACLSRTAARAVFYAVFTVLATRVDAGISTGGDVHFRIHHRSHNATLPQNFIYRTADAMLVNVVFGGQAVDNDELPDFNLPLHIEVPPICGITGNDAILTYMQTDFDSNKPVFSFSIPDEVYPELLRYTKSEKEKIEKAKKEKAKKANI